MGNARRMALLALAAGPLALAALGQSPASDYPLHAGITATVFWVGEPPSPANGFIHNVQSAWDDLWVVHYGGPDAPHPRWGYLPFWSVGGLLKPRENPFYFALPYTDFDGDGQRKPDAAQHVYWAGERPWADDESMVKNQWIRVIHEGLVAYAQWEDAGPFEDDDWPYVFGAAPPASTKNNNAGLDVSPALRDYLGLADDNTNVVSWQFVRAAEVPAGPWTDIVTASQVCWLPDCLAHRA
jgi:hypothetical protein